MSRSAVIYSVEMLLRNVYLKGLMLLSAPRLFNLISEDPICFGVLQDWVNDLHLVPTQRILEVGCATGTLAAYFARRGHRVTGVDRSVRMLRLARRLPGRETVQVVCGDLAASELERDAYDMLAVVTARQSFRSGLAGPMTA